MTKEATACVPGESLSDAAQRMWESDRGCLPVVADAGGRLVGMLTDRDICMATHFASKSPAQLSVASVMSRKPVACGAGDDARQAEALMRRARVRRLPVVDADGRLLGIVSLADLARAARGCAAPGLDGERVAATLAEICAEGPAPARPRRA